MKNSNSLILNKIAKFNPTSEVNEPDDTPKLKFTLVDENNKPLPQSTVANILAKNVLTVNLAYDQIYDRWMKYKNHVWTQVTGPNTIKIRLTKLLEQGGINGYSHSYFTGVLNQFTIYKNMDDFDVKTHLLPFLNGVFNLQTNKLEPHRLSYFLTWIIPYDYSPKATCEPFINWLFETVGNDSQQVELLQAYMRACILGEYRLQRYLELIGPGSSGKTTFIEVLKYLVGEKNTHTSNFRDLENNRFELAKLLGKKLLLLPDSEKYNGKISNLKAITSNDPLRFEEKFKQAGDNFVAKCLVVVTSNHPIQTDDKSSGLQRRRITVEFNNVVDPTNRRTDLKDEFEKMVSGILNWALSMDDKRMRQLLVETDKYVAGVKQSNLRNLLNTNNIANWAYNHLIQSPNSETEIGIKGKNLNIWLYANYCNWCTEHGQTPNAQNSFSRVLIDVLKYQFKLSGIERLEKKRVGNGFLGPRIKGIRIRTQMDFEGLYLLDTKEGRLIIPQIKPKVKLDSNFLTTNLPLSD